MAFQFRLPDIGEGVVEGEVVRWLVKVGDVLREDQPMVEVMTDKATVEIPSPKAGRVLSIDAPEGKLCAVGQVMLTIDTGGGNGATVAAPVEAPREVTHKIEAPVAPTGGGITYSIYDPTYYIDLLHARDPGAIRLADAPAACRQRLVAPNPSFEAVSLAAAADRTQSLGEGIGALFAESVVIACDGAN